jgi:hypothetical protein
MEKPSLKRPHQKSVFSEAGGSPQKKSSSSMIRAAQQFKYEPLQSSNNEIRLLRIKPASHPDETIWCEMIQVSLDTAPPYQALSYTWGDKASSHQVLVNQGSVQVTTNLKHALRRLRPNTGEEDLLIWVDAICINQQDIPERNAQTGKMRSIYRHAEKVSVWIGLENRGSKGAIQLALDVALSSETDAVKVLTDPSRTEDIEALVVLFRRQYWWRIWVIQEVSCGKETTMYCGNNSIHWSTLLRFVDIMKQRSDYLHGLYYKHLSKVRTLTHGGPRGLQLSRYSLEHAPTLLDLLLSHKSKNSTDPKDKVYALVGLCNTRDTFGNFDYSSSMRVVYSHTARHIISTTRQLDVICVRQHDSDQFDLPSWVPDWTRSLRNFGQAIIGLHHHEPSFSAAGDTTASVSFSEDGYVLKAQGFMIDRIKALGKPFKKHGTPADVLPALAAYHDWATVFFGFKDPSNASKTEFGAAISCGNWLDDDENLIDRLDSIEQLSQRLGVGFAPDTPGHAELSPEDDPSLMAAILSATLTMSRRRLFISASSGSGLAPWDAEIGDQVCVLLGCKFPVVLRPVGGHYILVGESYVNGFMDGEAVSELKAGKSQLETFEIH